MSDTPTVLVFAGSTRTGSLSAQLANAMALALNDAGAAPNLITLADYKADIYNGDDEEAHGAPQSMRDLNALIHAHDGVAIATPEYNAYFPPLLKNALDWCSRPSSTDHRPPLPRGKPAAVIASAPGPKGGIRVLPKLRDQMIELGFAVTPEPLAVGNAGDAFDEAGRLKDDFGAGQLKTVAESLVAMCRAQASG
ncbi:MAG: NAD(P)H-dependent oxidoreductase [Pseudomonadota bacterium]